MTSVTGSHLKIAGFPPAVCGEREVQTSFVCPQVLQMYLPFCGIAISNAQLFAASRKEYDRSRVRVVQQNAAPPHPHPPTDAGAHTVTGYLPAALIAARDHRAGLRGHLVRTGDTAPGSWSKSLRNP